MFGSIGGGEILLILTLALLLFGPRRLPQIGKTIGRTLAEFRRATRDLKTSLEQEVQQEDLKQVNEDLRSAGREISEAVSESNPLGGARGTLAPREAAKTPKTPKTEGSPDHGSSTAAPDSKAADRP